MLRRTVAILWFSIACAGLVLAALSCVWMPEYTAITPPNNPKGGSRPLILSLVYGNFYIKTWEHSGIGYLPQPGFHLYSNANVAGANVCRFDEGNPRFPGCYFDPVMIYGLGPALQLRAPLWAPFALTLLFLIVRRIVRSLSTPPLPIGDTQFCAMCAYDLTGNTSGRCPECGHSTGSAHT